MSDTPRTDEAAFHNALTPMAVDREVAAQLERELTAAQAEIARLKAEGCARDQGTTQFCSEALALSEKLEAAQARVVELEEWIKALDPVTQEPNTTTVEFGGRAVRALPGQVVFVGTVRPEGLR